MKAYLKPTVYVLAIHCNMATASQLNNIYTDAEALSKGNCFEFCDGDKGNGGGLEINSVWE